MEANGHVSAEEAARAHHVMWSMKRFRYKSGDTVGRLIDRMRTRLEESGALPLVAAAVRAIPARLRPAAFALASDLVLADGRIERAERQFLRQLADSLGLDAITRDVVLDAMLVKNSA
jgi:tellurite resistance protein